MGPRLVFYGVVALGVVAGAYYLKHRFSGVFNLVADGVDATGQIAGNFANMIADPLDAFGIKPSHNQYILTTPWEDPPAAAQDVVSNNYSGVNFNYF